MATRKTAWHGPVKDKLSVDELAEMFKLTPWDKVEDMNIDYVAENGAQAYREALHEGLSDKKAEELRYKAEDAAQTELYRNWNLAVVEAADALFHEHHLALEAIKPRSTKAIAHEYRVTAPEGWRKALAQIVQTINGVGMFHFSNVKELLDSGPYSTERIGVLTHLHHIKDYPRVYGTTSAERRFQRSFESRSR